MARSLVAPDSSDGVAQAVEAISETVHGAAGQDPWVAPAFSGEVGAARGSTDNQAQIATVVPPSSRQLFITDLGLESEAMRSATFGILDFIGWPEKEDLVYVCRYCNDWLCFKSDLWTCLVRKLLRCRFSNRKLRARMELQDLEWFEWDERNGPCYEWYDLVHDQASADRFNRHGSWDYCDWCGWWGWIETDTDLVLPKH